MQRNFQAGVILSQFHHLAARLFDLGDRFLLGFGPFRFLVVGPNA